jgi:hypothetical protein
MPTRRPQTPPEPTVAAPESRVRVEQLTDVHALVFGDERTAGPLVARAIDVPHPTLWAYLNRVGLPAPTAERLADEFCRRAARLLEVASQLRAAAQGPAPRAPRRA